MSALALSVLILVAPPPSTPPSPKAAARAAMATTLPPARPAPRRGERTWVPTAFSLTQDPGFTPWSSFLSLADGPIGRWTMEGTTTGGGLRCGDGRNSCESFAQAILALVWQPDGAPVGFYGGLSVASLPSSNGGMTVAAGPAFGVRIRSASLASVVRRARARSRD